MTGAFEQERRFLVARPRAAAFVNAVLPCLSPEIADPVHPLGYVRTTYFDTADWQFLRDDRVRRRLRVREYAVAAEVAETPAFTGLCALELKESSGRLRTKARFLAPPDVLAELLATRLARPRSWRQMLEQDVAFAPVLAAVQSGTLRPRVTTWYRRASLVGDGGVRVTIDDGIVFCRAVAIGAPLEPAHVLHARSGPVLEVKHGATLPERLAEAMRRLPEALSFSKFRAAAAHLISVERAA